MHLFWTFRVLHGSAPPYLGPLLPVHSLPDRRSLLSTGTLLYFYQSNRLLVVPPVKRSTVGSHAFLVAGPKTWNALPEDVTYSLSEYTFRCQLKTWFFQKLFRTSSSDIDCILTFSLGCLVTLRRFCRLRSTIWYDIMIWYLVLISLLSVLDLCNWYFLSSAWNMNCPNLVHMLTS